MLGPPPLNAFEIKKFFGPPLMVQAGGVASPAEIPLEPKSVKTKILVLIECGPHMRFVLFMKVSVSQSISPGWRRYHVFVNSEFDTPYLLEVFPRWVPRFRSP